MSTKFELPFDTCFACFQKSDDNCSCKSRKIYEQGKADAEKRYQLEYDRQIDNEQEAFENGYDKGYQQGYNDAIEECIKHIKLYKYNAGTYVVYDEILDEIAEQMRKGKENESSD